MSRRAREIQNPLDMDKDTPDAEAQDPSPRRVVRFENYEIAGDERGELEYIWGRGLLRLVLTVTFLSLLAMVRNLKFLIAAAIFCGLLVLGVSHYSACSDSRKLFTEQLESNKQQKVRLENRLQFLQEILENTEQEKMCLEMKLRSLQLKLNKLKEVLGQEPPAPTFEDDTKCVSIQTGY
ncbi:uncharacterized protein LOC134957356 isoform X2 [Pseudophryne corroboree]|uniref:uncharacterized protein LOC134957356 isoform X2 n=1 Tax=Pseudophryne corroboree TaxID=495146 RepID=UPI003081C6F2